MHMTMGRLCCVQLAEMPMRNISGQSKMQYSSQFNRYLRLSHLSNIFGDNTT